MKFEKSARIDASTTAVFDAVSDVQTLDRWIPQELHERLIQDSAVDFVLTEHIRQDHRKMRLSWSDDNSPSGYKGWVRVKEDGTASEVTIHVETPSVNLRQAEVAKLLTDALGSLEQQVASAGGPSR